MRTSLFIRRFIALSGPREIFTTRDLLNYGSRAAVDQMMCRLVKAGRVIRLARGVFVKKEIFNEIKYEFTPYEIAKVKAESFGRRIAEHGKDIAYKLQMINEKNKEITYATDGGSSSFKFGKIRIYFKKTALKKMKLVDTKVGQIIRALSYVGKYKLDSKTIKSKFNALRYLWPAAEDLRAVNAYMPNWLIEYFAWFKSEDRRGSHRWVEKAEHRPVAL